MVPGQHLNTLKGEENYTLTNNLLNSFMFHHFSTICSFHMCGCGKAEQTVFHVFHIVLECKGTSISIASETIDKLEDVLCPNQCSL